MIPAFALLIGLMPVFADANTGHAKVDKICADLEDDLADQFSVASAEPGAREVVTSEIWRVANRATHDFLAQCMARDVAILDDSCHRAFASWQHARVAALKRLLASVDATSVNWQALLPPLQWYFLYSCSPVLGPQSDPMLPLVVNHLATTFLPPHLEREIETLVRSGAWDDLMQTSDARHLMACMPRLAANLAVPFPDAEFVSEVARLADATCRSDAWRRVSLRPELEDLLFDVRLSISWAFQIPGPLTPVAVETTLFLVKLLSEQCSTRS